MKPLVALMLGLLTVLAINYFSLKKPADGVRSLGTAGHWTFTSVDGTVVDPAPPGAALYDLTKPGVACCTGRYDLQIDAFATDQEQNYLFIPAVGGELKAVRLNDVDLKFQPGEFSSVGPIVLLPLGNLHGSRLTIAIDGPPSLFSGLWHSAPYIGPLSALEGVRTWHVMRQSVTPLVSACLFSMLAVAFLAIYARTGRRFAFYPLFAFCLLTWSLFYLFLAGIFRVLNYEVGSLLHAPARALAALGTYALISAYLQLSRPGDHVWRQTRVRYKTALTVAVIVITVQIILGLGGHATAQTLLSAAITPLPFVPMLGWRLRSIPYKSLAFLTFTLACAVFLGQMADAVKLLDGVAYHGFPLPYSNRFVSPLLLSLSALVFIIHFSGFYESLRVHLQRLTKLSRSTVALGYGDLNSAEAASFAAELCATMDAVSCFIARSDGTGLFRIIAVHGFSSEALHQSIDPKAHPSIIRAIDTGDICLGADYEQPPFNLRYKQFAVVPVKARQRVEFLILLGERTAGDVFRKEDLLYLHQFALVLAQTDERIDAQHLQEEAERRFRDAVAQSQVAFHDLEKLAELNAIPPAGDWAPGATQDTAIARMSQTLAHDVRRPFSILRVGLTNLSQSQDFASVKLALARFLPEVDKAITSVDGLVADVLEASSPPRKLQRETTSVQRVIDEVVTSLHVLYPARTSSILYDLRHVQLLDVHVEKVCRVFANILVNGIEASSAQDRLWVKSRDVGAQIEFCIGNTGSLVASEKLDKIFDAFFTEGKQGGTGLGLAISRKIVRAHGGELRCTSQRTADATSVEFFFTLPAAASGVKSLATSAVGEAKPRSEATEIIVVEDNPFFLEAWILSLQPHALVRGYSCPEDLLRHLQEQPDSLANVRLVITDYVFDGSSLNGADLGRSLKAMRPDLPIYLSSDLAIDEAQRAGCLDRVIGKSPVEFERLMQWSATPIA